MSRRTVPPLTKRGTRRRVVMTCDTCGHKMLRVGVGTCRRCGEGWMKVKEDAQGKMR
jgi:hypothetical protein